MREETATRMRWISSRSSASRSVKRLLRSTTSRGSMKAVAPVEEVSCRMPFTLLRRLDCTGNTSRPPRTV
jgi:hypothetical protein